MTAEAPKYIPEGPLQVTVEQVVPVEERDHKLPAQRGVIDGISERLVLTDRDASSETQAHQVTFSWHHLVGTGMIRSDIDRGRITVIDNKERLTVADAEYSIGTAKTHEERVHRSAAAFGAVVRYLVNTVGSQPSERLRLTIDDPNAN